MNCSLPGCTGTVLGMTHPHGQVPMLAGRCEKCGTAHVIRIGPKAEAEHARLKAMLKQETDQ